MKRRRARVHKPTYPIELEIEGDAETWLDAHMDRVQEALSSSGAVLLHSDSTGLVSPLDAFQSVCGYEPMEYADQHTPRTRISKTAYTSTEYPKSQTIPFHSENSKNREWPLLIAFYCEVPATTGGATLISDNAVVLKSLPTALIDEFAARGGVKYVRNFHDGLGVSWRKAFGVDSVDALQDLCNERGWSLARTDNDVLRVSHVRPALIDHWNSGERLWFNQAQLFHPAGLDKAIRAELSTFGEERNFPSYVEYGDGAPIPDSVVWQISATFLANSAEVRWSAGDLLILDNMSMAHARSPYTGSRRVLVSMFRPYSSQI